MRDLVEPSDSVPTPGRLPRRRSRLAAILCTALVASTCGRSTPPPPPYNVILISVDTLRADRLNAYGYREHVVSPSIDALAEDGILFETHITSSPWTTPAHMSLMTSLHPSTHGLTESFSDTMSGIRRGTFNRLPDTRLTLAEAMRDAGYATAAFTGGVTLDPAIGFDQGFDHYDTSMYKLNPSNVDAMLDWVQSRKDQPFFLFWHTFEVHAPYLSAEFLPERHRSLAPELTELASTLSSLDTHSRNAQALRTFLRERDAFVPEVSEALYVGGIRTMDRWIARLVASLRSLELYDRTLIVFTSDHGDEFADRDSESFYDKHGHSAFDELVRVPLILKLPGQSQAGAVVESVSRAIDVMPTILDFTAIEAANEEMEGRSLRPLWEDPRSERGRVAFTEATATGPEIKSLRTNRWKYIIEIAPAEHQEKGRSHIPEQPSSRQLYDLVDDPGETVNLAGAGSERERELALSFEQRLRALTASGRGETEEIELDEEMLERLRALGYVR